jgi:hypothetical protein
MNAVQSYGLSTNNTIRAGIYYNRWVAPNGARFYVGRTCALETMSFALVDEHRMSALTLDAGLRLSRTYIRDYGGFNIDGTAKGFGKVEPITDEWEPVRLDASLGASYYLNPALSLHANAVAGTVKPREGTLDNDGNKPGDESRIKLDAGVRVTANRIGEAAVSLFLNEQKDAIVLSGLTRTVDGRTMELYINRDQRQYGVEVDLKSREVYDIARAFLNITSMDPRAEADGDMKRDMEMPRFISSAGVYGNWNRWDANLFWKYMSGYESLRFAAVTDPVPLGDFHTLNLTVGRSFGGALGTRVYAEIRNVTDEEFSTVVGYPDFGRRYTVGIRQVFR